MKRKTTDLCTRLAARGVEYKLDNSVRIHDVYRDLHTEWQGKGGVQWIYNEVRHEGVTVYTKLTHRGSIEPEQAVEATLGPVVGTGATDRAESFADVVNVLRKAAMGDFPGAPGTVDENLLTLMDRGRGDSLAGAFDELADCLQAAHERELENALDAHALQAAIENDDGKRYPMQKVLEILKRDMMEED